MEYPTPAVDRRLPSVHTLLTQDPPETPWTNVSTVIKVASIEKPVLSHSLPSASLREALPKRHDRNMGQHGRSRSTSDLKGHQRKSVSGYHPGKDETRVLPSCLTSPRRRSASGKRGGNTTIPDLTRKVSNVSGSSESLGDDLRCGSLDKAVSAEVYRRNKSDSGIVPDEFHLLSSVSASTVDREITLSSLEDCAETPLENVRGVAVKSLSEFESAFDDNTTVTSAAESDVNVGISDFTCRTHRNHSESEILDSLLKHSELSVQNISRTSKHLPKYHSLDFLNILSSGPFVPEINATSCERSPDLLSASRPDSTEQDKTENVWASRYLQTDEDHMTYSCASSVRTQSVGNSSRLWSEDSSDDVFIPDEDVTRQELTENIHTGFKVSRSVLMPNVVTSIHQGSAEKECTDDNLRYENASRGKQQLPSPGDLNETCVDAAVTLKSCGEASSDVNAQDKKNIPNIRSENPDRSTVENSQSADVKHPSAAYYSSSEQSEEDDVSQTSSSFPLHVQRTLRVVRERIQSKSTSSNTSKSQDQVISQSISETESIVSETSELIPQNTTIPSASDAASEQVQSTKQTDRVVEPAVLLKNVSHKDLQTNCGQRSYSQGSETVSTSYLNDNGYTVVQISSDHNSVDLVKEEIRQSDSPSSGENEISVCNHMKDTTLETSDTKACPAYTPTNSSVNGIPCSTEHTNSSQNIELPRATEIENAKPLTDGKQSISQMSKMKRISRVEFLLKNDLFKKHLSRHADMVEKNILRVRKFGLKKSFSNVDLTTMESEKLQTAFESSLKFQDSSFVKASVTDSDGTSQKQDVSDATLNTPSINSTPSVQNTVMDPKISRRKTLVSDDPSIQQLRQVLTENEQFSKSVCSAPTRRGRLHIPSFDEFRKQKHRRGSDSTKAVSISQTHSSLGASADGPDNMSMFIKPLDTIREDESGDLTRSANYVNTEAPQDKERIESKDDLSPLSDDITADIPDAKLQPPERHPEDQNSSEKQTVQPILSQSNGTHYVESIPSDNIFQRGIVSNVTETEGTRQQLDLPSTERGEDQCSLDAETDDNPHFFENKDGSKSPEKNDSLVCCEEEDDPIAPEQMPGSHFPVKNDEPDSPEKNDSSNISEKHSGNLPEKSDTFEKDGGSHFLERNDCSKCAERPIQSHPQGESDSLSGPERGDDFPSSPTVPGHDDDDNVSHHVSGSDVSRDPRSLSDTEWEEENVHGADEGTSPATEAVKTDFPYQLFEDLAVSLDTESWARLFTKVHKPRRRERSSNRLRSRKRSSDEDKSFAVPVLRSSSDVTSPTSGRGGGGQEGHRKRRLRKERPYKSDPLAGGTKALSCSNLTGNSPGTAGEGREKMLLLEEASKMTWDSRTSSFPSLEELTEEEFNSEDSEGETVPAPKHKYQKRLSDISMTSEESTDSGVLGSIGGMFQGQDTPISPSYLSAHDTRSLSTSSDVPQSLTCLHCIPSDIDDDETTPGGEETRAERIMLCDKCLQRQQERRETIYEIIETEINYGRDLRILKEEFYVPMQTTGLLTNEQLDSVFINLDELLTINTQLTEKLRTALHNAAKAADQELNTVSIGSLFIESSTMFLAFENYCLNQAQASASLEQLERERELLRIFLQVSQAENGLLRRMHLKSFLMVPVQRIMKYPLLLNRLYKATPVHHSDKEDIRQAREKIEDILGHINAKVKGSGSLRAKRKQSHFRCYSLTEKIEVNRVGVEVLGWHHTDVRDLITSRLWYAQPSDHTWASKRCRNIKFSLVHAVLFACRLQNNNSNNNNMDLVQQAAVVLVREKNGKYHAVRDPFLLEKIVVTVDPDCDDVFELQEWGREAYIFKAEDPRETRQWVQHLRQQTHNLGHWRQRRNALPNIMLKNV